MRCGWTLRSFNGLEISTIQGTALMKTEEWWARYLTADETQGGPCRPEERQMGLRGAPPGVLEPGPRYSQEERRVSEPGPRYGPAERCYCLWRSVHVCTTCIISFHHCAATDGSKVIFFQRAIDSVSLKFPY